VEIEAGGKLKNSADEMGDGEGRQGPGDMAHTLAAIDSGGGWWGLQGHGS